MLNQNAGNLEVLVLDDGSCDDTRSVIDRYTSDPRVRVFEQKNIGQTGRAQYVLDLSAYTLPASGLLVIKSPTGGFTMPTTSPPVVVTDTKFDTLDGTLGQPDGGHAAAAQLVQQAVAGDQLAARDDQFLAQHRDPRLEPVLNRTLGVPLFQEQMLKIAMIMANFSGDEAEELRRALSFHRSQERMEKVSVKLRAGMMRNNVAPEVIEKRFVGSRVRWPDFGPILATMAWTGNPINVKREVLIGFDLLLVLVVGLVLYAASARDPPASPDFFDGLQLLLVVSALVVDGVALAAIAARISEFGFTANRVAALGENLILLVNLAWSAWRYACFLRHRASFAVLERWQIAYLPVYSVWAAIVVIVFPPVFRWIG